jgi:hypothetical protein
MRWLIRVLPKFVSEGSASKLKEKDDKQEAQKY